MRDRVDRLAATVQAAVAPRVPKDPEVPHKCLGVFPFVGMAIPVTACRP
jgi:hypothetical protein